MKLIIIHGAPAAGKLTVANALAERTGYKVFHNHLSIDCVKPVFEFGSPEFWRVIKHIRTETIAEATHQKIDLIHTFCYEFGTDDQLFQELIAAAEDNGGSVHLVLLVCNDDVRRERIGGESRVRIGKLTDPDSVGRSKLNLVTPLPGRDTLTIDTTSTKPDDAADLIIEYFGLENSQAGETSCNFCSFTDRPPSGS
jgi:hypothetical protein